MKIHYEPHPVTPERKAELRAQGLKIIDAKYAPEPPAPDPFSREGIAVMGRADVVELLEAHGRPAETCKGVRLPELRQALTSIMFLEG